MSTLDAIHKLLTRRLTKARAATAARKWLVQMHDANFCGERMAAFEAWLQATPENRTAFERSRNIWQRLGDLEASFGPIPTPIRAKYRSAVLRVSALTAGGALAAAACAFVLLNVHEQPVPSGVYATAAGEITDLRLVDNSKIKLGARSEIKIDVTKSERSVELMNGEAFFDIAPDADHPFTVETGVARIRVLGTRFDVHTGPDGVSVTVAEGRVAVENKAEGRAATLPSLSARLQKGDKLEIDAGGDAFNVVKANLAAALAWQAGQLAFQDVPLSTVVADLNRYSEKVIVIEDDRIRDLRVTGLFHTGDFDSAITAISQTLPIEISTDGTSRIVLRRSGTQ